MITSEIYSEEEFGLFNSAYTGFLLYSFLHEFEKQESKGVHCCLPFIVIPILLNPSISSTLPRTYKTPISSWITQNEGILSDFPDIAQAYLPIVNSTLSFLFEHGVFEIEESGYLLIGQNRLPKEPKLFVDNLRMKQALKYSKFLGRWFSHSPSIETIFTQFGIRP
ncbi:MAG: three component ABC system middle component [Methyloligellaceae bacterium]